MSSKNPKCVIYSTPSKSNSQFAKIFLNKDNMFKRFEYTWDVVEGRDSKWVDDEIKRIGGVDDFLISYECKFPGTKEFLRAKNLLLLGV